jgi:hypothetical protein
MMGRISALDEPGARQRSASSDSELSSDLGGDFVVDSFRVSSMQKCKLRHHGSRH